MSQVSPKLSSRLILALQVFTLPGDAAEKSPKGSFGYIKTDAA